METAGGTSAETPLWSAPRGSSDAVLPQRPPVSVFMTVYNGERFLEDAARSVLEQSYRNFEFVIVDDGSTDRTESILQQLEQSDPRIRVVRQPNRGPAAALNCALHAAQHELVAHIDHDDRALPHWLESQLAFLLRHPECSVVSSFGFFINSHGKRFGTSANAVDVDKGRRELRPACFLELIHSTVLMRRTDILAAGGYRPIKFEDRDLWGRVVTSGFMIRCNPVPLVEYRLHGPSETTRKITPLEDYARRGVDLNVVRRLQGMPELSPLQLQEFFRNRPLWVRWQDFRCRKAGLSFREAARHFSEREWLPLTRSVAIAVALRPLYTVARARRKLAHS